MSSKDDIRLALNLKNLRRHDPAIREIEASTSYASVYENRGEGWVKTGVEGPMFLFTRSTTPSSGFFVLNRQGLEYVQEFLTADSEVRVEGEFILFEGGKDVDRATGIWVFEEKERVELCKRMEGLRQKSATDPHATLASPFPAAAVLPSSPQRVQPNGPQSISLDALFASASPASSPAVTPGVAPGAPRGAAGTLPNPLDALFASASTSAAPSPAGSMRVQQPPQHAGGAMPVALEQLFASASPVPQAARLPQQQQGQQQPQAKGGMALLDSIFASAKQSPQPAPAQPPSSFPAASPYNTPQPAPSSLPHPSQPTAHSPLPGTGSRTLPPVSPAAASASAGDARQALMSMIGLSSASPSASAASAAPPSPAQPLQANPAVNGDLVSAASLPAPRTASYPAAFTLDGAAKGEEKKAEGKKEKALPNFKPPVLSHDIFDMMPLPGQKKAEAKAKPEKAVPPPAAPAPAEEPAPVEPAAPEPAVEAETAVETEVAQPMKQELEQQPDQTESAVAVDESQAVEEAVAPLSVEPPASISEKVQASEAHESARVAAAAPGEEVTALPSVPLPPPAASSPALSSTSTPRKAADSPVPVPAALLLSKAELLGAVDGQAKDKALGMEQAEEPMSKEEFVRRVVEMVQKPSFAMQLYGRYLERWEEAQE
ncbi:hypothetical protein JCM10213_000203 [Rhodosporidiobolus nylandii]